MKNGLDYAYSTGISTLADVSEVENPKDTSSNVRGSIRGQRRIPRASTKTDKVGVMLDKKRGSLRGDRSVKNKEAGVRDE
jgi:hypothetical protein